VRSVILKLGAARHGSVCAVPFVCESHGDGKCAQGTGAVSARPRGSFRTGTRREHCIKCRLFFV
jgi:hypothetical protein